MSEPEEFCFGLEKETLNPDELDKRFAGVVKTVAFFLAFGAMFLFMWQENVKFAVTFVLIVYVVAIIGVVAIHAENKTSRKKKVNEKTRYIDSGRLRGVSNTLYLEGTLQKGEKTIICRINNTGVENDEEWRRFFIHMKESGSGIKVEKEVTKTCVERDITSNYSDHEI